MRRSEREVTDEKQRDAFINSAKVLRLAPGGGVPYIVPLNFAYENNGEPAFYFHCAFEGRKTELIGKGCAAGFELDEVLGFKTALKGCACTCYYKSVIGTGIIEPLSGEDKKAALLLILEHYGAAGCVIPPEAIDHVAVYRLKVGEMTFKVNPLP